MSLTTPAPVKRFNYAIFASRNLDDPAFLGEQIGGNLVNIGHIFTNGANQLVEQFARENGITCTVAPLQGSNLFTSTHTILEQVDAAYIVADESSHSAAQIKEMCEKKAVGYKLLPFEPITHWRTKVLRAQEILAAADWTDPDSVLSIADALKKVL